MAGRRDVSFQSSLFQPGVPSFDGSFSGVRRIALDERCWVDHAEGWVAGADALFRTVLESRDWGQRERWMYERMVREPRLTAPWTRRSGAPLEPPLLAEMLETLGSRYAVSFDAVGFNLYRDGRDSVAWHRDHILKEIAEPVIALVSLGERRKFQMRPRGGRIAHTLLLGRGDLLVTGGRTNLDWEHAIPKVAQAGPRISLAFRYGMDLRAYAHKKHVEPDR
jgi:alkylated DNA repair dioxygenase AlkB